MIPLVLVLMRIYGRWLELQKMQKCHWHSSGRSELAWLACWSMACTGRQRLKTKKRQTQGGWFATVQFVRKPVAQCFTCCRRHAWVGLPAAARCCQWWENVAAAKWKDFLPHSIIFMDNSFLTISWTSLTIKLTTTWGSNKYWPQRKSLASMGIPAHEHNKKDTTAQTE